MDSNVIIDHKEDLTTIDVVKEQQFRYDFYIYRRDHHLKTYFEKYLGMDLKAVYSDAKRHPEKGLLNWSCCNILLFLNNGKIVEMSNSEWASFKVTKG